MKTFWILNLIIAVFIIVFAYVFTIKVKECHNYVVYVFLFFVFCLIFCVFLNYLFFSRFYTLYSYFFFLFFVIFCHCSSGVSLGDPPSCYWSSFIHAKLPLHPIKLSYASFLPSHHPFPSPFQLPTLTALSSSPYMKLSPFLCLSLLTLHPSANPHTPYTLTFLLFPHLFFTCSPHDPCAPFPSPSAGPFWALTPVTWPVTARHLSPPPPVTPQ